MSGSWVSFSNWGIQPGMSAKEVFHTQIVNQLSLLALLLGLLRMIIACVLADWQSLFLSLFLTIVWILPPWFNRIGFPQSAKLSFLGMYLFLFVFFTLLTAESNSHWGVFFVAVAAMLFYTDRMTIWIFGITGLLLYFICEAWIYYMPPFFHLKYPLYNIIAQGVSVGLTFYILFALIIKELQISEAKTLSDKERLNAIINGALDAVITINVDNVITGWNPQAVEIFGYTASEALGQKLPDLIIPKKYRSHHRQGMQRYMETGEGPVLNNRIEIEGQRKNGEIFQVELTVIPVMNNNEQFFSAFIRDITEVKNARERLLVLNDELKQFASIASHDLKEPLRNIAAFSDLLLEDTPQDETAREYIAFIKEATDRMSRLLNDLIAFARAEGIAGDPHGIDLNQIMNAVRGNLVIRIHETNAEITTENLPVVMGHTTAYIQLFQNLLSNSLKFQPPGNVPKVHISAVKSENYWQISFKDNGIGIPPDKKEEIFKPFQRFNSEHDGSGIGLATCRKITERYGGRIWAEALPEGGSVFYIQLPEAHEA